MRGIVIGVWVIFSALVAWGQESPGLAVLPDGGFAPLGADFQVMFHFAGMDLASKSAKEVPRMLAISESVQSVNEWTSAEGGVARLDLCCVKYPMGLSDVTLGVARLRLTNPTNHLFKTTLSVEIAPEGAINALAFDRHAFSIEERIILVADTPSRGAILADSPFAVRSLRPQDHADVESTKGQCRGEMLFDLTIQPGQSQTLGFVCPVKLPGGTKLDLDFYRALSVEDLFALAKKDATGR